MINEIDYPFLQGLIFLKNWTRWARVSLGMLVNVLISVLHYAYNTLSHINRICCRSNALFATSERSQLAFTIMII